MRWISARLCTVLTWLNLKAFNITQHATGKYSSIGASIVGVIFLSTPHCGTNGPDTFWAELFRRLTSLPNPNSRTTAAIRPSGGESLSEKMMEICTQFGAFGIGLQIFSFFEMYQINGFKVR